MAGIDWTTNELRHDGALDPGISDFLKVAVEALEAAHNEALEAEELVPLMEAAEWDRARRIVTHAKNALDSAVLAQKEIEDCSATREP